MQKKPDLLKGLGQVKLEPSYQNSTTVQNAATNPDGSKDLTASDPPESRNFQVLFNSGQTTAQFIWHKVVTYFEATQELKMFINEIEDYDASTDERVQVFQFESFSDFFTKLDSKLDDDTEIPTDFKDFKPDGWVKAWAQKKGKDIKRSKILVFLHMKVLEKLLLSEEILSPKDSIAMLDKVLELARKPETHSNVITVLNHMLIKGGFKHTLTPGESIELNMLPKPDYITELIQAVQSHPNLSNVVTSEQTLSMSQILTSPANTTSEMQLPNAEIYPPNQIQASKTEPEPPISKPSETNNAPFVIQTEATSLVKTDVQPMVSPAAQLVEPPTPQSAQPTVQPKNQEPVQLPSQNFQESEGMVETHAPQNSVSNHRTNNQAIIPSSQPAIACQRPATELFGWVMKETVIGFPDRLFFQPIVLTKPKSKGTPNFEIPIKKLLAVLDESKVHDTYHDGTIYADKISRLHHSDLETIHFNYSFPEIIDLLFQTFEASKTAWKRLKETVNYDCTKSPFACYNCRYHSKFIKRFKFLSEYLLGGSYFLSKSYTLRTVLDNIAKVSVFAQAWMLQRLLPLVTFPLFEDNLVGDIDNNLLELVSIDQSIKPNTRWFFLAQVTIQHLSAGVTLSQASQYHLPKFLMLYLEFAGKPYLYGSHRKEYQAQFVKCCASVEHLFNDQGQRFYTELLRISAEYEAYSLETAKFYWDLHEKFPGTPTFTSEIEGRIKNILSACKSELTMSRFLTERTAGKPAGPSQLMQRIIKTSLDFSINDMMGSQSFKETPQAYYCLEVLYFASGYNCVDLKGPIKQLISTLEALKQWNGSSVNWVRSVQCRKAEILSFFSEVALICSDFKAIYNEEIYKKCFEERQLTLNKMDWLKRLVAYLERLAADNIMEASPSLIDNFMRPKFHNESLTVTELEALYNSAKERTKHVQSLQAISSDSEKGKESYFEQLVHKARGGKQVSLIELESACKQAQEHILNLVKTSQSKFLDQATLTSLGEFFKDETSAKKISEVLGFVTPLQLLQKQYNLSKSLNNLTLVGKISQGLLDKFKFVKDKHFQELQKLSQSYKKTGQIDLRGPELEAWQDLNSSIGQSTEISDLLDALSYDSTLTESFANLSILFDEFETKEASHFQNLMSCKEIFNLGLKDPRCIMELHRFISYCKDIQAQGATVSLGRFLRSTFVRNSASATIESGLNQFGIDDIIIHAHSLVRLSKNESEGLQKTNNMLKAVLKNSTISFTYDSTLRTHIVEAKPIDSQSRHSCDDLEVVTMEEMQSLKTQLDLFEMARKQADSNQLMSQGPNTSTVLYPIFIELYDHVEAIKSELDQIVHLGITFDLEGLLNQELPNCGQLLREFSRTKMTDSESEMMEVEQSPDKAGPELLKTNLTFSPSDDLEMLSLSVSIQAGATPNLTDISHFLVLRVICTAIHDRGKHHLLISGFKEHGITRLSGYQRIILCKWLRQSPGSTQFEQYMRTVDTFTNYAFNKRFSIQMKPEMVKKLSGCKSSLTSNFLDHALEKLSPSNQVQQKMVADHSKPSEALRYFATTSGQANQQVLQVFDLVQIKYGSSSSVHASHCLLVEPDTRPHEIFLFLLRAAQDPAENFYYLIDLHLLSLEVARLLLLMIEPIFFNREKTPTRNWRVVLFADGEAKDNEILKYLQKNRARFENLNSDLQEHLQKSDCSDRMSTLIRSMNIKVFMSQIAGLGKSTRIHDEGRKLEAKIITINLSGDISKAGLKRRFSMLWDQRNRIGSMDSKLAVHFVLDMVENYEESCELIDQLFFKIGVLKFVPYESGFIEFNQFQHIFLELQNTCDSTYLTKISLLKVLMQDPRCAEKISSINSEDQFLNSFDLNKLSTDLQQSAAWFCCIQTNSTKFKNFNSVNPTTITGTDEARLDRYALDFMNAYSATCKIDDLKKELACQLIFLITSVAGRSMKSTTLSQISYFLKMYRYQILEYIKFCTALYDSSRKNFLYSKEREEIVKQISISTVNLVWQHGNEIREETMMTQKVISARNADSKQFNQVLEEYRQKVKQIPDWGDSKLVTYFIWNCLLKIVCASEKDIPPEMMKAFSSLDPGFGKRNLVDETIPATKPISQNEVSYFMHLCEATIEPKYQASKRQEVAGFRTGFTFTADIYAKTLLIIQRANMRMPTFIMGPTGCGKTYLVSFIAECLLGDLLEAITLHPGVSEDQLVAKMLDINSRASQMVAGLKGNLSASNRKLWVLFDEFNTSHLQSLVTEIMINRKSHFHRDLVDIVFPENVVFVACCNPYKVEPAKFNEIGLTNHAKSSILGHRVYPIPGSTVDDVRKFGALKDKDEKKHIEQKLMGLKIPEEWSSKPAHRESMLKAAEVCHQFHRKHGSENSISLRDLTRFHVIMEFLSNHFYRSNINRKTGQQAQEMQEKAVFFEPNDALVVATTYCYILRLEQQKLRDELLAELAKQIPEVKFEKRFSEILEMFKQELQNFPSLKLTETFSRIVLNRPLLENMLALWFCIITKTPLLLCGKPGTSKSLAITVINQIFIDQDPAKVTQLKFFNTVYVVNPVYFWGTETTTAQSLEITFTQAEKLYQQMNQSTNDSARIATESLVMLVFDEIGLAELSKDNPNKLLHEKLEPKQKTFSFIGISNWKLDSSKMNRVLYVARPDMSVDDLVQTCKHAFPEQKFKKYQTALEPHFQILAKSFFEFRSRESVTAMGHPNFHGSRDFYSTVAVLARSLKLYSAEDTKNSGDQNQLKLSSDERNYLLVRNAIARNFSGLRDFSQESQAEGMLEIFDQMFPDDLKGRYAQKRCVQPSNLDLIFQQLLDIEARHLMIFFESSGIQDTFLDTIRSFQIDVQKLHPSKFVFMSSNKGRKAMIRLIMNQLPFYASEGYTVVMKGIQEVMGCLYELLNKFYSKSDSKGMDQCRLFYENHKQTINVNKNFKIILLMDNVGSNLSPEQLEKVLPPPTLNRFEKYFISNQVFMKPAQFSEYTRLKKLFFDIKSQTIPNPRRLIFNLSDELLVSLVTDVESGFKDVLLKLNTTDPVTLWKASLLGIQNVQKRKTGQSTLEYPEEQSVRKLAPLFNKNLILVESWSSEIFLEFGGEFRQTFLDAHPYNSIFELADTIRSKATEFSKFVVFTHTTSTELAELFKIQAKESINFDLRDSSDLELELGRTQDQYIHTLLADPNSILLVTFKSSEQYKTMQLLRYLLKNTPGGRSKPVIFTVHCSELYSDSKGEVASPITYTSKDWQMITIDDLKGCDYEGYFNLLDRPVIESLEQDAIRLLAGTSKQEFLFQMTRDCLRRLILQKCEAESLLSPSTVSTLVDGLCNRGTLLQLLSDELTMHYPSFCKYEDNTMKELIQPTIKELKIKVDSNPILQDALKQKWECQLSTSCESIISITFEKIDISVLLKILLLPDDLSSNLLDRLELELRKSDSDSVDPLFNSVPILSLISSKFNLQYSSKVEEMKLIIPKLYRHDDRAVADLDNNFLSILINAKPDQLFKSNLLELKLNEQLENPNPFLDPVPAFSLGESFLIALCSLEKVLETGAISLQPECLSMLLLFFRDYPGLKAPEMPELTPELVTLGIIVLAKVLIEELKVSSLCFAENSRRFNMQLAAISQKSFVARRTLELETYVSILFTIEPIREKKKLQQVLHQVETGIMICKRLPRLMDPKGENQQNKIDHNKSLLQREFFVLILNFMNSIQDPIRLQQSCSWFNQSLGEVNTSTADGLALLVFKFMYRLDIKCKENYDFLQDCIMHLIELTESNSSWEQFEIMFHILCKGLKQQTSEMDSNNVHKFSVAISKLIVMAHKDSLKASQVQAVVHCNLLEGNEPPQESWFAQINYQLINHTDEVKELAEWDQSLAVLKNLIAHPLTKGLLSKEQTHCLRSIKATLHSWTKDQNKSDFSDQKDELTSLIFRGFQAKTDSVDHQFTMLLLQMVYETICVRQINLSIYGLVKLDEKIQEINADNNILGFLPLTKNRLNKIVRLGSKLEGKIKQTYDQRQEWFGIVSPKHINQIERTQVLDQLSSSGYRLLVSLLAKIPKKSMDPNDFNLYQFIGIAANLMLEAPGNFLYSPSKIANNFQLLISQEPANIKQMLSVMRVKQIDNKSWTKAYKCKTSTCRFITTVGNCGLFGYHLDIKSSFGECPGTCKKKLGEKELGKQSWKEHLEEITMAQMEQERNQLLRDDSQHNRTETFEADKEFDTFWVQAKYQEDFKDEDGVVSQVIYLLQHVFGLASKFYTPGAEQITSLDSNLMNLLRRDFRQLERLLGKDSQTCAIFIMMLLDELAYQPNLHALNSPKELRKYLGSTCDALKTSFPTKFQQYVGLKLQISEESMKTRLKLRNFMTRNYTKSTIDPNFAGLAQLSIWMKHTETSSSKLIENSVKNCPDSPEVKFIADVMKEYYFLYNSRSWLITFRDFSNMIGKNFSMWFSKAQVLERNQESQTYKLTLQSLIDNSYFLATNQLTDETSDPASKARLSKLKALKELKAKSSLQQENAIDLMKEFWKQKFDERFEEKFDEMLKVGSAMRETLEGRLAIGCEQAGVLADIIKNLTKPSLSPLIAYTIANFDSAEESEGFGLVMKSFIEALLKPQQMFLEKHRSILPYMSSIGKKKRNFSECSDENFMSCSGEEVLKADLLKAAYFCFDEETNQTRVMLDAKIVAQKWANQLFSEVEDIKVDANFLFRDQIKLGLLQLCRKLRTKFSIEMNTDLAKVDYLDNHLERSDFDRVRQLDHAFVLVLSDILASAKSLSPTDSLEILMKAHHKFLIPQALHQRVKIEDCEAIRCKLTLSTYDSVLDILNDISEFNLARQNAKAPAFKQSFKAAISSADQQESQSNLSEAEQDLKILFTSLINHNHIKENNLLEDPDRVNTSVRELVQEVGCPDLLQSVDKWVSITEKTQLVELVVAIKHLELQKC